jgi:chromosome segregation ATPase
METNEVVDPATRLRELERALAAMTAERNRHSARADALTRELVRSETALAEVEVLRAKLAKLTAMEAERTRAQAYIDQLGRVERELAATRATISWRTTSPLRVIRRRIFPPRHHR